MTSALHQMTMSFSPEDDRLLFRVSTTDRTEYRLWFTRRFVRVLWGALMSVLEKEPDLKRALEPKAKRAVMAMQHHEAVDAADFSKQHDEDGFRDLTGSDGPALVVGGSVNPIEGGGANLVMKTLSGAEYTFALNTNLVHALCRLLIETTLKAEWDLGLAVGDALVVTPGDKARVH